MASYSPIHKIIVTGHKDSGKTSLINTVTNHKLPRDSLSNGGIDTYLYKYPNCLSDAVFHICETPGSNCHEPSVLKEHYENADGIIVVHDVSTNKKQSLECATEIIKEIINSHRCKSAEVFLVCNKIDRLNELLEIKEEQRLAQKHKISLFRTSAMFKHNVNEMFEEFCRKAWYCTPLGQFYPNIKHYNVLLIGDKGVGKTSLVERFKNNKFLIEQIEHPYITHTICPVIIKDQLIYLNIREGPDTDNFREVICKYYEDIHGIIMVYDVTSRTSFSNIHKWLNSIGKMAHTNSIPKILVGNKFDRFPDVDVGYEEASELSKKEDTVLLQASAKENLMVIELFMKIARYILKQHNSNIIPITRGNYLFDCNKWLLPFESKKKRRAISELPKNSWNEYSLDPTPRCTIDLKKISIFLVNSRISFTSEESESSSEHARTMQTVLSRTASEEIASLFQLNT